MTLEIEGMTWLNAPPSVETSDGALVVRSGLKTDFWQGTYYGFRRDDGHFLSRNVAGDFTATATFRGRYEALYDQAGLMLRVDESHWIKCGVEFTDGHRHFSVVATNGNSDWSVQKLADAGEEMSVRMSRKGDGVFIQYRQDSGTWEMARLAYFPAAYTTVGVGIAFCSPQREGFEATYTAFEITDLVINDIHD